MDRIVVLCRVLELEQLYSCHIPGCARIVQGIEHPYCDTRIPANILRLRQLVGSLLCPKGGPATPPIVAGLAFTIIQNH